MSPVFKYVSILLVLSGAGTLPAAAQSRWEAYLQTERDTITAIVVDMSLQADMPIRQLPYHLSLALQLARPSAQGLASAEEGPGMEKLQNQITQLLGMGTTMAPVGIVTRAGQRTLHMYTASAKADTALLNTAFIFYPQYKNYTLTVVADSAWQYYATALYPSAEERIRIENTHIIKDLVLNGDRLALPRPVEHFLGFATEKDGKAFYKKVRRQGFAQVYLGIDTAKAKDPTQPWVLQLTRQEAVAPNAIDATTVGLYKLAKEHQGHYLGWQTTVVLMAAPALPR